MSTRARNHITVYVTEGLRERLQAAPQLNKSEIFREAAEAALVALNSPPKPKPKPAVVSPSRSRLDDMDMTVNGRKLATLLRRELPERYYTRVAALLRIPE